MNQWTQAAFMCGLILLFWAGSPAILAADEVYDPLQLSEAERSEVLDLTAGAGNTAVDLRVYLPSSNNPAPVILFSHGLGGSRENNPYLGKLWSGRGYIVVFTQHVGSDNRVWQDQPIGQRLAAMRQAASLQSFMRRVQDVKTVLDQLQTWNDTADHALGGRLDMARIGMSGHSFGAVTTQAVSGQAFRRGRRLTDSRIKAAVAMSPSVPSVGDPADAFGSVNIPWMLMTGTDDVSILRETDVESRLKVYPNLKAPAKYEVVLHKGEHSAFSDRTLPGDKLARNPNHHRVILALSTAFWDAHLRGDTKAQQWLITNGPATVLQAQDRWQFEVKP